MSSVLISPTIGTVSGYPCGYHEGEVKLNLESHSFSIKLVNCFDPTMKPIPICLVILKKKNVTATEIYNITHLFYITVKVESFKKSDLLMCQAIIWLRTAPKLPKNNLSAETVAVTTWLTSKIAHTTIMFCPHQI